MARFDGVPVLVTGAGGFIGGHLAAELVREGADVRALVRYTSRSDWGALAWHPQDVVSQIEVVTGELRDTESVAAAAQGSELIFHLGAQIAIPYSYVNPRDYFETNVLGSLNVALAAHRQGCRRLIHTSTSEVYGSAQTVPITELHPLHPQSPYAASKVGADALMDSWWRSFGLPVTVLRPFNTYGPHQSARAITPTIISQALDGGPLRLGSLTPRRDMTFVGDTVEGFLAAALADKAVGETIQLGTGVDHAIGDIVEVVAEILGRDLAVQHDPDRVRPEGSEVQRLISSPARALAVMGWQPRVPLRDGLERTVAWIEANADRFRTDRYVI
jgi:dTDP-glucose 4,6-dehydratase